MSHFAQFLCQSQISINLRLINPRNIQYIHVVETFTLLKLEQN